MTKEIQQPLVSIVMPFFNAAEYIGFAVESLIGQTYPYWEAILINDGSTDSSLEQIGKWQDSRLKLVNLTENKGIVHALNVGLSLAAGKYIARMDADDICIPERLAKQVAVMEANPNLTVLGSAAWVIDEAGQLTGQQMARPQTDAEIKASLFFGCPFIHPTIMMRKSVLENHGITYDSSIQYAQDYVLYSHLWKLGAMCNLPEPLLNYRVHQNPNRVTANENKSAIVAGRMLAWHQVLQALSCKGSVALLTIHDKFCYYPHTILPSENSLIIPYFRFFLSLAAANLRLGVFDKDIFQKYLTKQVERIMVFPALPLHSFIKIFSAASHAGLSPKGKKVLVQMVKNRVKKVLK